jgi:hypothetical protein
MHKLVMHHTYRQGLAWDVSKTFNHGQPTHVAVGYGPFVNSLQYSQPNSRVLVRPSKSLEGLRSIRILTRVFVTPVAGGARRLNILEGHASFALFINPDRSIQGTFLDPEGDWVGPRSSPGVIPPNTWLEIDFSYDGISVGRITVNGVVVATSYDLRGPVRGVGPNGLVVGHWPEPDDRYTFQGYIGETQLWKYDEENVAKALLDPCCTKGTDWAKIMDDPKYENWTEERLFAAADGILTHVHNVAANARKNSTQGVDAHEQMTARMAAALTSRDPAQLSSAFDAAAEWGLTWFTAEDFSQLMEGMRGLVDQVGMGTEDIYTLANATCFGWIGEVLKEKERAKDDGTWPNRRPPD